MRDPSAVEQSLIRCSMALFLTTYFSQHLHMRCGVLQLCGSVRGLGRSTGVASTARGSCPLTTIPGLGLRVGARLSLNADSVSQRRGGNKPCRLTPIPSKAALRPAHSSSRPKATGQHQRDQQSDRQWIAGQVTDAFPWDEAPRHLIRDRDGAFGPAYTRRIRAMGIRDHPSALLRSSCAGAVTAGPQFGNIDHMVAGEVGVQGFPVRSAF
jgi:hypothetical protein